jgi:adenosylcobinamide-GDP ribazoletransferase
MNPPRTAGLAVWTDGLRLAITLLTIVPFPGRRRDGQDDAVRDSAGRAMILAPAAGVIVGGAAALVLVLGDLIGLAPLPRAALAVAAMEVLTRALHLDGLADLADGLGSGRPAAGALEIMKRSDIGPFGVVTLLLTLLVQVAALASAPEAAAGVVIAAVAGRLVLPWACRTGVPAARPDGLGALVAGTVPHRGALASTGAVLVAVALTGAATGGLLGVLYAVAAVAGGLAVAYLVLLHAVRRLGGVTGDVLGALVEVATTAALIVLATA